jgi:DNA (cytosine-5)-methyltransferase 1
MKPGSQMKYYFIDLFCGCGGTSYGINNSKLRKLNIAEVVACVNHDKNAIASHQLNHPEAIHFIEDIRTLYLQPLVDLINEIRAKDPFAIICLWASLECTNHSNAKGGMSRDADSRTLAQYLFRYLDEINFDMVWIENVREFKAWGPLMHKKVKGKLQYISKGENAGQPMMVPIPHLKGTDYRSWVSDMKRYGFKHDDILVNSADYGARTSRKRLFVQFVKEPLEIHWPEPTHDKLGRFGREKWLPVRPLLKLNETGESIFNRKKPYSDNTYARILRGIIKHKPQFFIKYYGNGDNTQSIGKPCPTLTTKDRMSLVTKEQQFISYEYGNGMNKDLSEPCTALTTKPKGSLVSSSFLYNEYSSGGDYTSLDSPCPAVTTVPKSKVMTAQFLIDSQYKNNGTSVDKPCGTLLATMVKKPKYLVSQEVPDEQYLMSTHFKNDGQGLDQPGPALTANRKNHYVVSQFLEHYHGRTNTYKDINEPCTALATNPTQRLVSAELTNKSPVKINRRDSPSLKLLKKYMIENGITDIKMRPLFIEEILTIMGFPADYKLVGTKTEAKKFIGNAVETRTAKTLIYESYRKNLAALQQRNLKVA